MTHTRNVSRFALLALGLLAILVIQGARVTYAAPPTDLFISEYIEGSSNNKAVEIYNGTGAAINLATGGYELFISFNGGSSTATFALTGTVANGDVYVFAASTANATILAQADQTTASGLWNGDDFIALRKTGAVVVDSFGVLGTDPGTEWGTGLTSTADNTLQRKDTICAGDTNTTNAFDPATEWNGFAVDTFTGLGSHTANCGSGVTLSVNDVSLAEGDSGTTAFEFTVSLSALAPDGGVTFDIATADNTATDANNDYEPNTLTSQTIPEGETEYTFTVQVNGDTTAEANETFFVNVTNIVAATAGDVQGLGTIQNDDVTVVPIHDIQGNGESSPVDGQTKTIEGIVVGVFRDTTPEVPSPDTVATRPDNAANELNGFFVQEENSDADADPNTSEGIFVFEGANPSTPAVALGDKVRVTGTVDEFGDSDAGSLTELVGPLTVVVVSSGNALPTAASIDLPVATLADYEKYENMRVTFVDEMTVTEVFTLGRYGEILLAAGGRLDNPTHVAEPGAPAQAVRDANILRSIYLDDGLTNQNPEPLMHPSPGGLSATNTLRGGDTTTGLTGVLNYLEATEEYRIQPSEAITWNHVNPRPATPPDVGGTLQVVGSNTLNYFITLDTGGAPCGPSNNQGCRGANTSQEFTRQHDKLINMLVALDADVFGLVELENNSAANPANDDNDPVLESIVNALNAELGAGTYAFIDTGTIGTDVIKAGLIYKPASVTPVGDFEILDDSYDPAFQDDRNRPVLAQTFEDANGEMFTVAVAHLKSKGSACTPDDPDSGDLSGNCNGTRTAAAEVMVDWFTNVLAPVDPDILLVGDLNSYAKEAPIDVLVDAGYVDLAAEFNADPYSYVFDGEWGYLDYAFASPSLADQVTDAAEWHINADEPIVLDYNTEFKFQDQPALFYSSDPFRVSDHDPIIVGLELPIPDTTAPDVAINQASGQSDPTNTSPINFTVTFTEPVTGFETGDVTLSGTAGATTATVSGGPTTYNVAVSGMTANGTVIASIAAGVAEDAAANGNTASTSIDNTVTYDATAPDTTITANPMNPSNDTNPSFSFSGDDGSGVGGLTFECRINAGLWLPCTSPQAYPGLTDGSYTFEVRAIDSLGNTDQTPAGYTWVIDTAAPTVTINQASGQADPTSSSPINFTVVFSEAVTGFAAGDVALSGTAGATTATVSGGPTTYNVAVSGMTGDGTVIATVGANGADDAAGNGNTASTSTDNTVTYVAPVVAEASVFLSTTTAGTVGPLSYGSEDVLEWDGSAWSLWFDGSAAGLTARNSMHNINAFSIPDPNNAAFYLVFAQNARKVPGILPKVDGMDIVHWDGSTFSLWFDGQDVGLTNKTQEKIDGLQVLPGSASPIGNGCLAYLLISTQGPGKVPNYDGSVLKFGGEDVLGFCATTLGDTTHGQWHMLLDGSAEGMPKNSTDSISLSDDGDTLYFTTKGLFSVPGASGGHSMVYAYDLSSGEFSGPVFSAPATGINRKVDGLDYRANMN